MLQSHSHPDVPTYIVISAPPQVRFAGTGFMALAPNAAGPNQLQYTKKQTRALIAIYRNNESASKGELTVTPFEAGAQVYSWAVVSTGTCGEQILAQGEQPIEVNAGAPKLVVQNRFINVIPNLRIRSRAGTYDGPFRRQEKPEDRRRVVRAEY
jgi:hypothetical protein